MRFSQQILIAAVATAVVVVPAAAAMAHVNGSAMNMISPASYSYSGSWPVTITGSQHGTNGTYCLTLTENGHESGSASFFVDSQTYYGSFLVINRTLVATIEAAATGGANSELLFIGSAKRGDIGPGVFEDVYGGSVYASGALAFGTKGGC